MSFAFLFRKEVQDYDFGENHPFHGRRGELFFDFFKKTTKKEFPVLEAEPVEDEDLHLICEKDYIEFTRDFFQPQNFEKKFNEKFFIYHSQDNFPTNGAKNIERAARFILGQAKLAVELVLKGKYKKVVSIGGGLHHAKQNFGEGFCIYNDVAFCAKYLLEKEGLERILILDTDVHCGNGTMEYFYKDKRVLFIDIHQDPTTLYPGTGFIEQIGESEGKGFTINIPLPPFSGNKCYQMVFEEIVEPIAKKFSPQIVIRNGGSDPHFSDPLANLNLDISGFEMIGERVKKIANLCDGKEIDLIASGYNLKSLPLCWTALICGLFGIKVTLKGEESPPEKKETILKTKNIIKRLKEILKNYWNF